MRRSGDRSRETRDHREASEHLDEDRVRELERKRKQWRIEQEQRREHEKRKQKMIQEYEEKRARELEQKKQRRRSKTRSRSASPGPRRRRSRSSEGSRSRSTRAPVTLERRGSSSTINIQFFKGNEGTNVNVKELKKIKVNIERDIPNAQGTSELLRDIESLDDIVLKRREGEGSKPIFEREELNTNDTIVPERRTVVLDRGESSPRRPSQRRSSPPNCQRSRSTSEWVPRYLPIPYFIPPFPYGYITDRFEGQQFSSCQCATAIPEYETSD
uniref:Transformer non-sex-specific isoform 1 n=1 Tax=Asobara tabida TaxID=58720 RepID=A0A291B0E3_ASOTA|nr:transformer non-sex-specific isoform 1 [Asobara tabida]